MAKTGLFDCIKAFAGDEQPNFLLNTARELQTYVYRIKMEIAFGAPMFVIVGEPKLAREILVDPLTYKGEMYRPLDGICCGVRNIFTTDGAFWHARRKDIASAFSSKHIQRMNTVASQKVNEWIETRLEEFIKNDEAFDVGEEMINITLATIAEAGFEYGMSSEEMKYFTTELNLCLLEFAGKSIFNPLRQPFGLFIKERRRAFVAASRLQQFALKIIDSYRKLENPTKDTILDRIIHNKAYEDDKERAADLIVLLTAGHDTTAYSVAWIFKELAKNPKEQKKLRQALISTDREKWNQLGELRNAIKEGMRLHPVGANGPGRFLGRDFISDDNLWLKKGSIVSIPIYLLTRNHYIYNDADSFIPSRWDDPTTDMNDAFLPFAVGPQNCVGQSMAKAEMNCLIPEVCSKYELKLEEEGETKCFLTLKPVRTMIKAIKIQ